MLNRSKPIIQNSSTEPAGQMQAKLDLKIEELQRQTINESLAESFPAWDLNPPAVLVRRRSSKLL
ncbi:hypothetical protein OHJ21_21650 [Virgibacillus sp. LDC1]|jgi:hypothetical protein|uniref:hypothetical protein n=1 Tax=Paenibacillus TaxID=44249 RepID=UPI000C27203B|nr:MULTISPECIES: hypothetical protein [Paenibacillus]MCV4233769.1 hypothetical protein [Virgibacillus sp. LDC1]MEC0207006.1 hypothetical protein [Paenibacillus lautus]MEC0309223.1 hypothetical protein [Paenibacillus lautus]PJN51371.1 hypothetical protein PAEVO_44630 [Paenibacillus sp. GM2FR]